MVKISGILLGAGESKRMGVDKLSLPWRKKTVFEYCFEMLLRSEVSEVIVVLKDRSKWAGRLSPRPKGKMVVNPNNKEGMSTSIREGILAMDPKSQGILLTLGDQPFVKTRTVNALIRAFAQGKGGIVIPSFRGRRGHPVIFHKKYREELLGLEGDAGGRSVVERHPEDVLLMRVKSEGVVKDLDTWEDYKKGFRIED